MGTTSKQVSQLLIALSFFILTYCLLVYSSSTDAVTLVEQNENSTLVSQETCNLPQVNTQRNYDLAQDTSFCNRFIIGSSLDQSTGSQSLDQPTNSTAPSSSTSSVDDPLYIPNLYPYSNARENSLAVNQRTKSLTSGSESADSNSSLTGSLAHSTASSGNDPANLTNEVQAQSGLESGANNLTNTDGNSEVCCIQILLV